ncbi:MAG: hypothetical protein AB7P40_15270 [Chloroflexota bacterium]
MLSGGDIIEQRVILGPLIEKLEVERMAFGKFRLITTWPVTGDVFRDLRSRPQEAA